jgi:hypothetical protein
MEGGFCSPRSREALTVQSQLRLKRCRQQLRVGEQDADSVKLHVDRVSYRTHRTHLLN